MVTFTRTQVTAGRSTTTEAGTRQINPSQTGREQKIASNGREVKAISNAHPRRAVPTILVQVATVDPVRAAPTDQVLILKIWTARPRIDHVATFQASAFKALKVADLIAVPVAGSAVIAPAVAAAASEDSEEIALAAEDLAAAVIDSVAVPSVAAAVLADSAAAAAGLGADGKLRS
jgi:hypothetical protein